VKKSLIQTWLSREKRCPIQRAFAYLESTLSVLSAYQLKISRNADMSSSFLLPTWEKFTSALAVNLLEGMPIDVAVIPFLLNFLQPEWKDNERPDNFEALNFFTKRNIVIFPDDVEGTSLAALELYRNGAISQNVFNNLVEKVVSNTTSDSGVIHTYLPPQGSEGRLNRICSVVCCNSMRLIYFAGQRSRALKTEQFLMDTLDSKAYVDFIGFYSGPDTFLYFLSKAVVYNCEAKAIFLPKISSHILDRIKGSKKSTPLASAYRILAAEALGLLGIPSFASNLESDVRCIRETQLSDGSWPNEVMLHGNRINTFLGSEVGTTLYAARALQVTSTMWPSHN